jgi:hypothetical protein
MSLTSCIMTYIARSADPQRPECTVLKALEISNLGHLHQESEGSEGVGGIMGGIYPWPRFRSCVWVWWVGKVVCSVFP